MLLIIVLTEANVFSMKKKFNSETLPQHKSSEFQTNETLKERYLRLTCNCRTMIGISTILLGYVDFVTDFKQNEVLLLKHC